MNPYENIDWMLNDDKQLHLANVSGWAIIYENAY